MIVLFIKFVSKLSVIKTTHAPTTEIPSTTTSTTETPSTTTSTTVRIEPSTTTSTTVSIEDPQIYSGQMGLNDIIDLLPQADAQQKPDCEGKPADIYFLLDASSSVYIVHFHDQVLGFVRDLVSNFQISPLHTRVGVVTFSNDVSKVQHKLVIYKNKYKISKVFKNFNS